MSTVLKYGLCVVLLLCFPIAPVHTTQVVTLHEQQSQPTRTPSFLRGINFAGDFEVSPRRDWGSPITSAYFDLAVQAGFDHVRVPIRWSAHTAAPPDYTIDPAFFEEVDWLLNEADRVGLSIIINTHHFEGLNSAPDQHREQLLAIWRQVAWRYRHKPRTVAFELNNEPTEVFDRQPELWNEIANDTLQVVRESNPERLVIIGPVGYNHPGRLYDLELPEDKNLMITVHVYDPDLFTLQGAPWIDPPPPTGLTWHPLQLTPRNGWNDASWDSVITPSRHGIQIQFDRQHAAFAIRRDSRPPKADEQTRTKLIVESNMDFSAIALCNVWSEVKSTEFSMHKVEVKELYQMTADLSDCGPIHSIAIQSDSTRNEQPLISSIKLCTAKDESRSDCNSLLVTQTDYHAQIMQEAHVWAVQNNVPVYLGEFGVYDPPGTPVNQASKLAWIRSIREATETYKIGWAFFEFSNDFGILDKNKNTLKRGMLDALFN